MEERRQKKRVGEEPIREEPIREVRGMHVRTEAMVVDPKDEERVHKTRTVGGPYKAAKRKNMHLP